MRQTHTVSKDIWGASSTDSSEDCSTMDDDPLIVSLQLACEPETTTSVHKAYQGMIDMLDESLQVICTAERSEISTFVESHSNEQTPSSSTTIPCLATVLFFNGDSKEKSTKNNCQKTSDINGFSKPDLLLNHMWNGTFDLLDFEKGNRGTKDFNENELEKMKPSRISGLTSGGQKTKTISGRRSPFLRYDVILKESKEKEKSEPEYKDFGKENVFDLESAENTLEARKQLQTWPWEFHHRANTSKGITQCHGNSQDFYAYQPVQDVTRLYGDVIDTSKISRRKNLHSMSECEKDAFIDLLDSTADKFNEKVILNERNQGKGTISTKDFPLMAVREVHYGRQHLRYMLFVSDTAWTDQVEFYRLLLRRHEVTLRENFCFFTVYSGEKTDIQFALKRLDSKQKPIPLSSTVMQFKVHNVGQLVPLLPHACKPICESRWQTQDHDGNVIVLEIQSRRSDCDNSSSQCDRNFHSLEEVVTSPSEMDGKQSSDDEYSLERLDSFVEPELPHRMPLLKPTLYTNWSGRHRFGRRTNTSSPSPGSSSSNSPERRPPNFPYTRSFQRIFPGRSMEMGSCCTLPPPRLSSTPTYWTSSSRFSESSDEPENTNFYRRAKLKKDVRRKSEGCISTRGGRKDGHRSTSKSRQKHKTHRKSSSKNYEDEIEVYV